MSGYINKEVVNERGNVRVIEGTLTDGSCVYDVEFRADGVLVTLACTGPEQADSLMIQIDKTLEIKAMIVDSEKVFAMAGKVRGENHYKRREREAREAEPRMVTKDSPDFESLRNEGRVKCSDTPGLFIVTEIKVSS